MQKQRLFRVTITLFAIFGFVLSGCSPEARLPDPETASGVYVHSGFEFYRWEAGLRLMIWHDGIHHSSCSSSTDGQYYQIQCQATYDTNHSFAWHLETKDGKTAQFSINGDPFDLVDGSLFIVTPSGENTAVRQLNRDLSEVQANAESVIEFGLSDPDIHEFIQTSTKIQNCISECVSSSTTLKESSDRPGMEAAQQALISFFFHLHEGKYDLASTLYGGEYDVMRDNNPNIDPDDHPTLFKNACTINGFQCLEVRQSTLLDQPSPAEFRFTVEFSNEDGSLFSRGPCCGDDNLNHGEQTAFIYTVRFESSGKYQVLEMPVYVP